MAKRIEGSEPIGEQPTALVVRGIALQDLPAGSPLLTKDNLHFRVAEQDDLYRANATAPYDVPEGGTFDVEVASQL